MLRIELNVCCIICVCNLSLNTTSNCKTSMFLSKIVCLYRAFGKQTCSDKIVFASFLREGEGSIIIINVYPFIV